MSSIRLTMLIVSLVIPAVVHAADGALDLYLQPFPSEASRLTFAIGSVSAVSADGSQLSLGSNLKALGRDETVRQRLLASGRLPVGSYTGFVFTVKEAALRNERGSAALVVPGSPLRIDVPFVVASQQASVIWLTFKYEESIGDGVEFSPVFLASAPPRPIADHAGFVTNSKSNTITVFDKSLSQVVSLIETCAGPSGLALDQPRRRLYVACSDDDEVQAIDVTTATVIERTRVSPGDRPREIALTPDGNTLVSVNTGSNSISLFDALSLTRQERINVGSGPGSIAIDTTGRRAFIFNTLSSSLSVVDLANRTVAATISTESAPLRGQFNRRGDRLFIVHERSPYMTVFDPRTLAVITRARVRMGISAIAIDPVRDLVCVGGGNDVAVEFYDPNALMPIYSMRTSAAPSYLAVDPEDNSLYLVSRDTRTLSVAQLASRKPAWQIDVGEEPYWVAVMGER